MKQKDDMENQFIVMIKQNERIIYKVCSFYISSQYSLDDLYQETVYNLWKAYPKFRGESSFSTWIYRIALNTCISRLRKETRQPTKTSFSLCINLPADPIENDEDIKELYNLIYQLKSIDKAIILLWLEEKSYQEIANIVGLTVNNVAVRIKRIKDKLKSMSQQ
jgi:RNA polymerase sigma-70 factor (ECF subfamily)